MEGSILAVIPGAEKNILIFNQHKILTKSIECEI